MSNHADFKVKNGLVVNTTASFLSTITSTSTVTGAVIISGGVGIAKDVFIGGNIVGYGTIVAGGVRTTSTSTPPSNPTVGDIWYNTLTDDIYRYTSDGSNAYWLDITGPTVANASGSSTYVTSTGSSNVVIVGGTGTVVTTSTGATNIWVNNNVVATLTDSQTLTNKTLTSPTITDGVFQNTFSIGTQVFYPHDNGFSVNENFDITNQGSQSNFTGYHFASGTGKNGTAFTLARSGYFTDGFGITGDSNNNNFVIGSETSNTDFLFKKGVGMPFDVSGGTTIFTINRTGSIVLTNDIVGTTTQNVFNTGTTSVNFAGSATTINIGAVTGVTSVNNRLNVGSGASITGTVTATTFVGNLTGTATTATTATNAGYAYSFNTTTVVTSATTLYNTGNQVALNSNGTMTFPSNKIDAGSNIAGLWSSSQSALVWRVSGPGSAGQPLQSVVTVSSGSVTIGTATGLLAGPNTAENWVFDIFGNITFPDSTIQTTAFTGTATTATYAQTVLGSTQTAITSLGTLTRLNVSGIVTATNFVGTLTTAQQPNITSVGTLTGLSSTGTISVNYTPATTIGQAIVATGKDTLGGTGYFDFLRATNNTSGGANGTKTFRIDNTGTFQILNNVYNATIFSVTDNGYIAINQASGATNGIPVNNGIAMNNNSYIFDDGNYHITSKSGSIWINANDGSSVNINTQVPSGTTPGGMVVQGAVQSQGSGTAATSFISGIGAYSGIALQMSPNSSGAANQAIRDTSSAASTMYFDVNTGGTANGTFKWRSSNSFTELMVLNSTSLNVNKQMLIGGGSQSAYVTINGTNSYNANGPYGYLSGGGAGNIGSGGSTGNVSWSLYCNGRIQSNEVDVTSDERLKDIQGTIPLDMAIKFVKGIDGILYTWKPGFGDDGVKSGFGAQSVHKAGFDHMVAPVPNDRVEGSTDADGFTSPDKAQLTLNYQEAIPYHHEVIKHLLDRIEQLENIVASLTTDKNVG